LPPGPQGIQGIQGPQGPAGTPPPGYCVLGTLDPETNKYSIICGGTEVGGDGIQGQLDQCSTEVQSGDQGLLIINCPGADPQYFCGGQWFDPAVNHCEMDNTTSNAKFSVPRIMPSICGGLTYDSRTHFCDANTAKPLCGIGKEKYSASRGEECSASGTVVKRCGTNTYVKATHFCLTIGNTSTVVQRCGTPVSGIYNTGSATGDYIFGSTRDIMGGYSSANAEQCLDGKVVKRCGSETYEEKTHFCAAGDVVAPHCDDRVIYNPAQRFCSYRANPGYAPTASVCDQASQDYDADNIACKEFSSTALVFCGVGSGLATSAAARYNDTEWKWEYCVPKNNPDVGSITPVLFSVFRCAQNQIPDNNTSGGVDVEKCTCVLGGNVTDLTSSGRNGCQCNTGYVYQAYKSPGNPTATPWTATGYGANGLPYNYTIGQTGTVPTLSFSGGQCAALPTCNQDPTYCTTIAACKAANGIWDSNRGTTGACIKLASDCTLKFGAYNQECKTARGTCDVGGDLDACLDYPSCRDAGGFWDMYVISNQCVESATDCQSGSVTGTNNKLCEVPNAVGCAVASPSSCVTQSTCTAKNLFWDGLSGASLKTNSQRCTSAASCPTNAAATAGSVCTCNSGDYVFQASPAVSACKAAPDGFNVVYDSANSTYICGLATSGNDAGATAVYDPSANTCGCTTTNSPAGGDYDTTTGVCTD